MLKYFIKIVKYMICKNYHIADLYSKDGKLLAVNENLEVLWRDFNQILT